MDRARRAGSTALIVVVMVGILGGWSGAGALAAAVGWPPSTLVISEIQTGGASASDEFVEIANQGSGTGRPRRPGGRLCDVQRLDGDAQGDVDRGDDPRARAGGS